MDNDIVRLPAQPLDMLDFLQEGITMSIQQGVEPAAIIETFHDYACYWLHAMDNQQQEEPAPMTRLN